MLGINFPAGASVQFLFLWHTSQDSIYFLTSFITSSHQKFLVTNSVIFYCSLYSPTSVLWCNQITSILNFLSHGTYTFLSLSIRPFSSLYSLSLNIFTPAHFIFSTTFITLSSFTSNFLISSSRSSSLIITSITYIALTSNHSFFTSTLFSLSLSMPICQSGHLLRLSAYPILLSGTCFRWKLNLNRYRAHHACLLFNFWLLMKYSRFL